MNEPILNEPSSFQVLSNNFRKTKSQNKTKGKRIQNHYHKKPIWFRSLSTRSRCKVEENVAKIKEEFHQVDQ